MSNPLNPYASPQSDTEEASDQAPRGPDELRIVYVGLSLVYWGVILGLLGLMAMIAALVAGANPESLGFVGLGGLAAVAIGALMMLIGQGLCLTAPRETHARLWVVATIVLQILNPVLLVVVGLLFHPGISGIVSWLLTFLAAAAFVMALQRLAEYIGAAELRTQAQRVLVVGAIQLGVLTGGTFLAAGNVGGILPALFGLAILLGLLTTFVMYVNLINAVRKAIGPAAKAAGASL